MKKEDQGSKKPSTEAGQTQERSFTVALEQMAQFLRTEVKLKDRNTKVLSSSANPTSFNNSIEQIAKLLRTQIQSQKTPKKRSWKSTPKPKKA
ncbi:MAG: hypothetical protein JSS60_01350 [Verrucomicrobia bacterium]|nr:hypothetical protein [Verrucomicrobiota bacterium]